MVFEPRERKLFSLAEANAALERVAPIVEELSEVKRAFDAAQIALNQLSPSDRTNGHQAEAVALERRLEDLVERLVLGLRELEELGIEVKNLEQGIIDFPSRQRGRIVYLCWQVGEETIGFWHELNAGFAGRRPVSELDA